MYLSQKSSFLPIAANYGGVETPPTRPFQDGPGLLLTANQNHRFLSSTKANVRNEPRARASKPRPPCGCANLYGAQPPAAVRRSRGPGSRVPVIQFPVQTNKFNLVYLFWEQFGGKL